MSTTLAIAWREFRSYFLSPIAYVVLALFLLLTGYFFYSSLIEFVNRSLLFDQQAGMFGSETPKMNINEWVIRPLLFNLSVVALFLAPMITMRLLCEERKSGTVELLMTSPITEVQVAAGKFLAGFGLYLVMLLGTAVTMLISAIYSDPDPGPVLTGYLGLVLLGAACLALGTLVSSLTENQMVAGFAGFVLFLVLWLLHWASDFTTGKTASLLSYLSLVHHFEDMSKGILDTRNLIFYLSLSGCGLFATIRSLESARWRRDLGKQSLAESAHVALNLLLLLGLLVALNYLASRHYLRTDLTASRLFSLSEQTRRILAELDRDVKVIAFYRAGDPAVKPVKDLIKEYDDLSPRLSFEVVDPDRDPARARHYPNLEYGVTVVDAGDRTERVGGSEEATLTNALIKVTRDEKKKVGFVTGHGERDPLAVDQQGYSAVRARLVNEGYEIEIVNLATRTTVPPDIRTLVIAGASKELLPHERLAVASYLERGGSAFILADPAPHAGHAELLRAFGIEVGNDVVVDVSGVGRLFGADEFLPMGLHYRSHPLTKQFNLTTVYPHARSVRPAKLVSPATEVTELVFTAPASWAESRPDLPPLELGPEDRRGPVCVMAAATRPSRPPAAAAGGAVDTTTAAAAFLRLVVAGDSDFCANGYSGFGGNLDLALNAIEWLVGEEDLIAIRPRNRDDRRVHLTKTQAIMVRAIVLLALPFSVVAAGLAVWWRRR